MSQSFTRPSCARSTAPMGTAHMAPGASSSMISQRRRLQSRRSNNILTAIKSSKQSQQTRRFSRQRSQWHQLRGPSSSKRWSTGTCWRTPSTWVFKSTRKKWRCFKKKLRKSWPTFSSQRWITWISTPTLWVVWSVSSRSPASTRMITAQRATHTKRAVTFMGMPLHMRYNLTRCSSSCPLATSHKAVGSYFLINNIMVVTSSSQITFKRSKWRLNCRRHLLCRHSFHRMPWVNSKWVKRCADEYLSLIQ